MKRKIALFITLLVVALLMLTACNGAKFGLHKVTFDADGGELGFFEGSKTVQTYGTVDLPTPTKEGYVFEGWFIGEGVNEDQFTATSMVTSDITLKAKWRKAEYTVTFLDHYDNVIARETVSHGEAANAPSVPRISEERLRFDAWDTDISAVKSDLTVKALYVIDAYKITYVTNNSQTIPDTSYFFDETPVAPPQPGLGGHYFIGWYLDEAFTTEYHFDAPLTEDITLYAYFNESIPIETLDDLLAIPEHSNNKYFIKNDIDCEGAVITTSIIGFAGVLDGEGHTISNFVYQPAQAENVGLFATNGGTIKNINFSDFSYTLTASNINSNVGFLAGNNTGTIENVHLTNVSTYFEAQCIAQDAIYNFYFGSVAGNNSGNVVNCSIENGSMNYKVYSEAGRYNYTRPYLFAGALVGINSGNIKDSVTQTTGGVHLSNIYTASYYTEPNCFAYLSGLVSVNDGTVSNCEATIDATTSIDNGTLLYCYISGFVCTNNNEIASCSSKATINNAYVSDGAQYLRYYSAGFAFENHGTIKNSYTNVDIEFLSRCFVSSFGGFVTNNYAGIDHCYAYGTMNVGSATDGKGGFAGMNDGSINSCFADVNITATDATLYGPFVGNADTASYITNSYYSNKGIFITNGAPQIFDVTYAEATDPLNLTDKGFIIGTLGWSEDVWECDPNKFNHPTLK